jgi:ubiquitin C-terminal hydrolase
LKDEELDSFNLYHCENCNSHQNAIKKYSFLYLPDILILHFKRFKLFFIKKNKIKGILKNILKNKRYSIK